VGDNTLAVRIEYDSEVAVSADADLSLLVEKQGYIFSDTWMEVTNLRVSKLMQRYTAIGVVITFTLPLSPSDLRPNVSASDSYTPAAPAPHTKVYESIEPLEGPIMPGPGIFSQSMARPLGTLPGKYRLKVELFEVPVYAPTHPPTLTHPSHTPLTPLSARVLRTGELLLP
jgi:hypothetical protein